MHSGDRKILPDSNRTVLIPPNVKKDRKQRLILYCAWLESEGCAWTAPDLRAYHDYLQTRATLSSESVKGYLSSVRGRYQSLLRDNDFLHQQAPSHLTATERDLWVAETRKRIEQALIDSDALIRAANWRTGRPDTGRPRLSREQAYALMMAPGYATLVGLRDTAIFTLMLCTGIREDELCALTVPDLAYESKRHGPCLHIAGNPSSRERLIPYGQLKWALWPVRAWLTQADIHEGAIFRAVYGNQRPPRPSPLSGRAVQNIFKGYPILIDGNLVTVTPHDLRRTYALRLYQAGLGLRRIRQYLGHATRESTEQVIGKTNLVVGQPVEPIYYGFDGETLSRLQHLAKERVRAQ